MFNLFKPKSTDSSLRAKHGNLTPQTKSLTLHLSGLHCTSCAVNIDLALEDLPSVKSKTNYAKSETIISNSILLTDPKNKPNDALNKMLLWK